MERSLRFLLNGNLIQTVAREESLVLDWLRGNQGLTGTKEGCREGDCGACLAILGERDPGNAGIEWFAVTTCLLALAELDGRHLVTIEGLAANGPTPVMIALHEENASQCGFCSPGVAVALTAGLMASGRFDEAAALAAVEGNLCRCTGYASIRRAAAVLAREFGDLPDALPGRLAALAARAVLPALAAAMAELPEPAVPGKTPPGSPGATPLGGGTDYYVRNPDPDPTTDVAFIDRDPGLRGIREKGEAIEIGAAVTVREFFASDAIRALAPGIGAFESRMASSPIRARATLAGNVANASPVADMTAILVALAARVRLAGPAGTREVPLEDYFVSYKKTLAEADERIAAILVPSGAARLFSFEKASKRESLDIASVNTAFSARLEAGVLKDVRLSAGGVGPVPMLLRKASAALEGKAPSGNAIRAAAGTARDECTPISDVRSSAEYRSSLLERLVKAHFIRLFPDGDLGKELFP